MAYFFHACALNSIVQPLEAPASEDSPLDTPTDLHAWLRSICGRRTKILGSSRSESVEMTYCRLHTWPSRQVNLKVKLKPQFESLTV